MCEDDVGICIGYKAEEKGSVLHTAYTSTEGYGQQRVRIRLTSNVPRCTSQSKVRFCGVTCRVFEM